MWERGKLFVFEGPDGVGKSTLSKMLATHLDDSGVPVRHLSFPGRDAGTLGKLVYTLHHEPDSLGVADLSPTSRQTLHIAAHLDAIERIILPALESGNCVILDRFWWSTWVYGVVDGVSRDLLRTLLQVEQAQWGKVLPKIMFLTTRDASFREDEPTQKWQELAVVYRELAESERNKYAVQVVTNDAPIENTFRIILEAIKDRKRRDLENIPTLMDSKSSDRPLKVDSSL